MSIVQPKVLGLDVSTKTIGWALFDLQTKELLELSHFSPRVNPRPEDKVEEHLKKCLAFDNKLQQVTSGCFALTKFQTIFFLSMSFGNPPNNTFFPLAFSE